MEITTINKETLDKVIKRIENTTHYNQFKKGVYEYAKEMTIYLYDKVEKENVTIKNLREILLKGSTDWYDYSTSGKALTNNDEIAKLLGENKDKCETWLGIQARGLRQGYGLVKKLILEYM